MCTAVVLKSIAIITLLQSIKDTCMMERSKPTDVDNSTIHQYSAKSVKLQIVYFRQFINFRQVPAACGGRGILRCIEVLLTFSGVAGWGRYTSCCCWLFQVWLDEVDTKSCYSACQRVPCLLFCILALLLFQHDGCTSRINFLNSVLVFNVWVFPRVWNLTGTKNEH